MTAFTLVIPASLDIMTPLVIPAKAGIQPYKGNLDQDWAPAFAGVTVTP